jgi:hypothetical protein
MSHDRMKPIADRMKVVGGGLGEERRRPPQDELVK